MQVQLARGVGDDSRFYVTLCAENQVVLVISKVGLFRLGLSFYHVAMGNRSVEHCPEVVEVPETRVVFLGRSYHRVSSETSVSSNHQGLGADHTLQGVTTWLLFETLPGRLLLSLLERWAGLAVVDADRLGGQVVRPAEG